MTVQRLTHLGICVSDLERSVAFYCDVFGLEEVGRLEDELLRYKDLKQSLKGQHQADRQLYQRKIQELEDELALCRKRARGCKKCNTDIPPELADLMGSNATDTSSSSSVDVHESSLGMASDWASGTSNVSERHPRTARSQSHMDNVFPGGAVGYADTCSVNWRALFTRRKK